MLKKNTAILLGAALICGLGFAIVELGPQRVRQQREEQSKQLLKIPPTGIQGLTIEKADDTDTIVLNTAEDNSWHLTRPLETRAEDSTVQSLIESLASAEAPQIGQEGEASPLDLAVFGLEEPQYTLIVEREGEQSTIAFGDTTFDNSSTYVRVDDGPIRVLEIGLTPQLNPSLFALRDKSLTDWSVTDLQTFEIISEGESIVLVREEDGWKLEARPNIPLDASAFADTLSQASFLQASQFIAETQADLASYGLDSPRLILKANLTDGTNQTLSIGSEIEADPNSDYAISNVREGVVGIMASQLDSIATTEFQLRDSSLGPISSLQLGKIEIISSDPTLSRSLVPANSPDSDPEQWTISDDPDRLISIDTFLSPLSEARAKQFIPADDASVASLFQQPSSLAIKLFPAVGVANDPLELEFAPGESELYVRTSHNPDILQLDLEFYELLEAAVSSFKPAT